MAAPSQFHASLPGQLPDGASTEDLANWWAQFDDPLVAELIDAAQASNQTLAQALARIAQARANLGSTRSALFPSLDANANARRSKTDLTPGTSSVGTSTSKSLDSTWEIDMFGGKRKGVDSANARLAARIADWHGVRVSLAAEVAVTLVNYRACEATAALLAEDLISREQTAQLTMLKIKAGFTAPADGALIDASTADARQRLIAQRADCDMHIKALTALTDIAEPALRDKLAGSSRLPRPRGITVNAVPAKALAQRPDIASAERELAATSADINVAEANRYPRLTLLGSIGIAGLRIEGNTSNSDTWSFGPSISLPLFDAGRRKADVDAARARYDEAYAAYQQQVRTAVREIEEALVRLDSSARREDDAASAARNYDHYFHASDDKFKVGSGSLFELEDARRTMLSAHQTLIGIQRERVAAWIALYKALGGGWNADTP